MISQCKHEEGTLTHFLANIMHFKKETIKEYLQSLWLVDTPWKTVMGDLSSGKQPLLQLNP